MLDRSKLQDEQSLIDFAQDAFDAAKDELEAAKDAYDKILTTQETNDLLEARAKLALIQERYDTAQDRYNGLLTGKRFPPGADSSRYAYPGTQQCSPG